MENIALFYLILPHIISQATSYHIVGFFLRYLNSENGRFSVFCDFIFTNGSAKGSALQWVVHFFEGLNFTNDQHP